MSDIDADMANPSDEDSPEGGSSATSFEPFEPVEQRVPRLELNAMERRVVGSLIEKEFVTPDVYPMTTNAIVTACNQKTNRDPVVSYSAVDIDSTLLDLRQRNLVRRVHTPGSRSTKHRQTLDEALSLDHGELALVSVLLLRGPQTVGELRLRSERQYGFEDIEATEGCLQGLAARSTPLVMRLERQPGHKEARWQHLLADEAEAAAEPNMQPETAPIEPPQGQAAAAPAHPAASRDVAVSSDRSPLESRVTTLEAEVGALRRQLASLAAQLGETLE